MPYLQQKFDKRLFGILKKAVKKAVKNAVIGVKGTKNVFTEHRKNNNGVFLG